MRMEMSAREFDRAHLIFGDINRYAERTWSYERYRGAVSAFDDCVVFHDADVAGTVVHTPSANLEAAPGGPEGRWRALVLAHTPDRFVSRLPMTATGRVFDVLGGEVREVTASGEIAPLAADVYAKSGDRHYAGRLDEKGAHSLWKGPGDYRLTPALPDPPGARSEPPLDESKHELVGKVRLCRDLGGRYVPVSASPREHFRVRADGRIEVIDERPGGSTCRIVEDERGRA